MEIWSALSTCRLQKRACGGEENVVLTWVSSLPSASGSSVTRCPPIYPYRARLLCLLSQWQRRLLRPPLETVADRLLPNTTTTRVVPYTVLVAWITCRRNRSFGNTESSSPFSGRLRVIKRSFFCVYVCVKGRTFLCKCHPLLFLRKITFYRGSCQRKRCPVFHFSFPVKGEIKHVLLRCAPRRIIKHHLITNTYSRLRG